MDPTADLTNILPEIADALIGTASPSELIERLGRLLESADALPAQLCLIDPQSMTYYPVSAWGCEVGDEEIDASAVLLDEVEGGLALTHRGDPIGVLVVAPGAVTTPMVQAIASILGPVLDASQERERALDELRRTHERVGHLLRAGTLLRHLDLDVLLVEILQASLAAVQADVGALLVAEGDGPLSIRVTWGLQDHHVNAMCMKDGATLSDHVHATGRPCVSHLMKSPSNSTSVSLMPT